jgi:hypothetical protein
MGLDLSGVTRFVEKLMIDTCRIERYAGTDQTDDSNWDEATGTYIPGRVEPVLVYEGECMFWTTRSNSSDKEEGSNHTREKMAGMSIPLGAPDIIPEDQVTITDSEEHPKEVGYTYFVTGVTRGTYMASTDVEMKLKIPTAP